MNILTFEQHDMDRGDVICGGISQQGGEHAQKANDHSKATLMQKPRNVGRYFVCFFSSLCSMSAVFNIKSL